MWTQYDLPEAVVVHADDPWHIEVCREILRIPYDLPDAIAIHAENPWHIEVCKEILPILYDLSEAIAIYLENPWHTEVWRDVLESLWAGIVESDVHSVQDLDVTAVLEDLPEAVVVHVDDPWGAIAARGAASSRLRQAVAHLGATVWRKRPLHGCGGRSADR